LEIWESTGARYLYWKREASQKVAEIVRLPRNDSPLAWEVESVKEYALKHPKDGYRRLAWQMVDEDVVYLSESTVYRILQSLDLLYRWKRNSSSSGRRPPKADRPNQRWHTDLMYLRVGDTWYFLVSFIDAYSRYIVHWELLTNMTAEEVTLAVARALEKHPGATPEIVSDHGSQYTSGEFKALMRQFELEHILCRIYHPQSNGVIERYHRTTREELEECEYKTLGQAREVIKIWVAAYNEDRLHAGLGFLRPADYFFRDPAQLRGIRSEKLKMARENRITENNRAMEQAFLLPPETRTQTPRDTLFQKKAIGSI
jgi:transposase InsO family protein